MLVGAGSDGWTKALISRRTFDREAGKELYVKFTPYDSGGVDRFMLGWEKDQLSSPSYTQLWHGIYWIDNSLRIYENGSSIATVGSYSWSTSYEIRIVLLATGARYYIKGGAYGAWTLLRETLTYADTPIKMAFTQYSHRVDVDLVRIKNYSTVEPVVASIGTPSTGCFGFSSIWTAGANSNEDTKTTMTPDPPTFLEATTVSDTQTDLTWTDNTDDESGFKIERCIDSIGTGCTPTPVVDQIGTSTGYDPSLTMLLRMDESYWSGLPGEVLDSAGTNNGQALHGADTVAAGFDRAGDFDGYTDYISVPDSAGVNPTEAITVGLWAKSDTANWNATGTLASKRKAYILSPVSGSKNIEFHVYTTLQWFIATPTVTPTIDLTEWHHYAGTYDGNEIKIFIDGNPVGSTIREGGVPADPGNLYIGRDDGQSRYFDGLIDEVTIYDTALSDSEMLALVAQGAASNTLYSDTLVSPSVDYCYQVRAYKTAPGCGGEWNTGYSNVICQETPPVTPTGLQATAENSLLIRLDWNDLGDNEVGFEIERKIWGGTYILIETVGTDVEIYYDTSGIEPESAYTYRIRAYNAEGYSDYSSEASVVTPTWSEGDSTCIPVP